MSTIAADISPLDSQSCDTLVSGSSGGDRYMLTPIILGLAKQQPVSMGVYGSTTYKRFLLAVRFRPLHRTSNYRSPAAIRPQQQCRLHYPT